MQRVDRAARFGIAALFFIAALCLHLVFADFLDEYPFLLFICAIVATALYCGVSAAILVTLASALSVNFFIMQPGTLRTTPAQAVILALFVGIGVGIAGLVHRRDKAIQQQQASEERFRIAQELSPDGFTVLRAVRDTAGDVIDFELEYLNPAAHRLLRRDDLVGKRLLEVLPGNRDRSDLFDRYKRIVETAASDTVEIRYDADGLVGWFHNTALKLGDGVAVWFSEITERKSMEEAIRRNQEELRLVTDSVPVLISHIDSECRYIFANRGYEEWFGAKHDSIRGRHMRDVIGKEAFDVLEPYAARALASETVEYRAYVPCSTGGRHIHAKYVPSVLEDGVRSFFVVVQDVSEQLQAEEALRSSEAEMRATFELSATGEAQSDPVTGRFTRVNQKFCDITGYSRDELLNLSYESLTHPDDHAADLERIRAVIDGQAREWMSEKRYIRKDGRVIWVQVMGTVLKDTTGKPYRTIAVIMDITERREAEEALRQSEARMRIALDTAKVVVYNMDIELRYTWIHNPLGVPPSEMLLGKQDKDVWPTEEQGLEQMALKRRILETGERLRDEVVFGVESEERVYARNIEPLRDPRGVIVGLTGAATDITQIKSTERELRALNETLEQRVQERTLQLEAYYENLRRAERLAAIGEIVTGLSHESRNALQTSLAAIELLSKQLQDAPSLLQILNHLKRSQNDLQRIHNDVREYAAPIVLECTDSELCDIWREAWDDIKPLWDGGDARLLETDVPRDTACCVDAFRFRRVFRNLLENALAACSDPVEVSIAAAHTQIGDRPALRVVLQDNGTGINPETLARIFEPFYTTKPKGTGLGMSIVRRIMEEHDAQVVLESPEGEGLKVILVVPRERPLAR